jgi:signal transduction histidine kinase/CheY-like chemotaxis protein
VAVNLKRLQTEGPRPVVLEEARIDGRTHSLDEDIEAPPGGGSLEFVYTTIDFQSPGKTLFRYKLEGFDRDWVEAGSRRTAYYTNIPPGAYQFSVSAGSVDAGWSPRVTTLGFVLLPHFYQTIWFKCLEVVGLLLLAVGIHLFFVHQMDERERALSRRVDDRTKELRKEIEKREQIESNLVEAKDAAEKANAAKSDFLANMSHEIRTPMHGILGMTELVLGTELTSEQHDYLSLAQGSAQSLISIINDILDFSKVEAGKIELETIEFNLGQLLDECVKSLGFKAQEKGLELICDPGEELPGTVSGDPLRLRQILLNLLGNAIKFTSRGEVVLSTQRDGDSLMRFAVRDTGIGIPADKLDTIFDAFSQADTSTTRTFGGTGLGLAISSRLVALMGGSLSVTSELSVGSKFEFSVSLPACAAIPSDNASDDRLGAKRALVIEDNATLRQILQRTLKGWGMLAETAEDGSTGLQRFEEAREAGQPFALVLTDALMPGMDGFSLARELRSRPGSSNLPVVAMLAPGQTGGSDESQRNSAQPVCLIKPFSPSDLRDALLEAFSGSGRAATSRTTAKREPRGGEKAGSPLRILLAEDNLVNQKIAVRMLEKRGHSVLVASNGAEALRCLARESFDLLLTDMQMPEMDGFQTAAAIREREKGTGTRLPIVAMTALAMKGDRERCLNAGMDGYVSKPMKAGELFSTIEKFAPTPVSQAK